MREDAALIEALERVYLWMDRQSDAQSKGGHATFDLMMLREERDAVKAAIDAAKEKKKMELETLNKLYLELSQITTATTAREILLQKQLAEAQKVQGQLLDALTSVMLCEFNSMSSRAEMVRIARAAIDAAKGETS